MRINSINSVNFKRRLRAEEEADYTSTLRLAKEKAGNRGKSILIVPASSLPQSKELNTGVGNLASKDGLQFFDFAKKYWGINGVQILPVGQYHSHRGEYPIYSGTSMDLGNHIIDIKSFATEDEFKQIIQNNKISDKVNFSNVVEHDSVQEKVLQSIYERDKNLPEFQEFKAKNISRLEPKGIYQALKKKYGTGNFKKWYSIDKNLFNPEIVSLKEHEKRINEIKKSCIKEIDFYEFKQFLAEKSLQKAKTELNNRGIKLYGDMLCGFSFDEVWAHPNAFMENASIGWGLPALDFTKPDGEKLLREKTAFYAQRFDGFRVDASWTYVSPRIEKSETIIRPQYGAGILDIIDDEAKKVKGFDTKNIMHEFSANAENFSLYEGGELKPFVKDRVKICTLKEFKKKQNVNKSLLELGWPKDSFILGISNHDSKKAEFNNELKKKLFSEPVSSYNNMLYFIDALGMEETFQHNGDRTLNYASKIHTDYEKEYFNKLAKGEAFNPMDALEKSFIESGLDKDNPKLFKKIVKYRKILEEKEGVRKNKTIIPIALGITACALLIYGLCKYSKKKRKP